MNVPLRPDRASRSGSSPAERFPSAFDADLYERIFPAGIERDFWHKARCAIVERALRTHGLAGGRVLDVGCGRGIMLAHLRRAGIDARGCEPSPLAPVPPELTPFVARETALEQLDPRECAGVEAALLLDVIEHLPDPVRLLTSVRQHLPGLRGLLVTVPARMSLWTAYDARLGHYRRYNRALLARHLEEAGFEPLECGYFFHGLYPALRLLGIVHHSRSERFYAPRGAWLPFHALVARWFIAEQRLFPGRVPGSSLLAVARPRHE